MTTRRSFLQNALATGAAAQVPQLFLARDLLAKPSGAPIIIGHQCDLTGGFSSWGYWCDKATRAAVDYVNDNGGIAGRPVEYVVYPGEGHHFATPEHQRDLLRRTIGWFQAEMPPR